MPNYQRLSFGHRGGAHKHGNLSNPQLHPQGMRQCPPRGLPECQGQVRDTITQRHQQRHWREPDLSHALR